MAEEIKELEKTLKVDGQTYNINAVKADKVVNSLVLTKKQLNGDTEEVVNFNGSAESGTKNSLEIVPAAGGRFSDRITVPSVPDNVLSTDGETVLNYNDIVTKVVDTLINTSTAATWIPKDGYDDPNNRESEDEAEIIYENDPTYFEDRYTLAFTEESSSVNGICVVVGPGKKNEILYFTKYNFLKKLLPYFIYVSTDTWNMWFGGYNFFKIKTGKDGNNIEVPYVKRLAQSAAEAETASSADVAKKLATPCNFSVSLETSDEVDFDGTADAPLGVTGILPIGKGGTNAITSLAANCNINTDIALCEVLSDGKTPDVPGDDTQIVFKYRTPDATRGALYTRYCKELWSYIASKIRNTFGFSTSNILTINNGGTGNTTGTAKMAEQDTEGRNIKTGYYRSVSNAATDNNKYANSITISSADPTNTVGVNGDIWIKYS